MPLVWVPALLQDLSHGQARVTVPGSSVRQVIENLDALYPGFKDRLLENGIICRADDRLDPVIQLAPPLNIPQEDVDQVVVIVADVIHALGRKMGTQPTMQAVRFPEAVAV